MLHYKITKINSDKVGACASIVCAVHCLALPILILTGADSIVRLVYSESIERALLYTTLIVALLALVQGFIKHKQHYVPILFATGCLLISMGESLSNPNQKLMIPVLGASVIIYAHVQNHQLKQKVRKC